MSSIKIYLWEGIVYNDDRIYILDLTPAKKGNNSVWAIVTRRNCDGFPAVRTDEFKTKEEAIDYIGNIEPSTPLISFNGKSPVSPLSYRDYCDKLNRIGISSAIEIYELNKNIKREIVIQEAENKLDDLRIDSNHIGFETDQSPWQLGDRIDNRFEIKKILGGGMGTVYVCYDHKHKIPVALKTLQEK